MTQLETKQQVAKIQNKLTKFIEDNSIYQGNRDDIKNLYKQLKQLPDMGIVKVSETVEKAQLNGEGKAVKTQEVKEKRQYLNDVSQELHTQLKQKRKRVLRFNKKSTLYINRLCEQIITQFIKSCESLNSSKKQQEKTFGWKQFNQKYFNQSFVDSLVRGSSSYMSFLDFKNMVVRLDYEKEINRLQKDSSKSQKRTVLQDLQKYKAMLKEKVKEYTTDSKVLQEIDQQKKQLKSDQEEQRKELEMEKQDLQKKIQELEQQKGDQQAQKVLLQTKELLVENKNKMDKLKQEFNQIKDKEAQVLNELYEKAHYDISDKAKEQFGDQWADCLSNMYDGIYLLQKPDGDSKMLFNMVKNQTKQYQQSNVQNKLKISNGYKHLISRILREFLVKFAQKVEIYLEDTKIKNLKVEDIRKIVQLWVTSDDQESVNNQIKEFEQSFMN